VTPEQAVIRIDPEVIVQLREYSGKTGVPMTHCANEALRNWLDAVAPRLLAALGKEPLTPRFESKVGYGRPRPDGTIETI
jgi:hypothetical protein